MSALSSEPLPCGRGKEISRSIAASAGEQADQNRWLGIAGYFEPGPLVPVANLCHDLFAEARDRRDLRDALVDCCKQISQPACST